MVLTQSIYFWISGTSRECTWTLSIFFQLYIFNKNIWGLQGDVVYRGWPIAPSYMNPNAGGGELRGLSQWVQLYTGAQINFGDLTPYLIYEKYSQILLPSMHWFPRSFNYEKAFCSNILDIQLNFQFLLCHLLRYLSNIVYSIASLWV